METSNYICILETSADRLMELISKANENDIRYSIFREPDYDNAITAVALEPDEKSKKICSNFRLALKEEKKI